MNALRSQEDLPNADAAKHWVGVTKPIPCCDLWPDQQHKAHKATTLLGGPDLGCPSTWATEDFQSTLLRLHQATTSLKQALAPGEPVVIPPADITPGNDRRMSNAVLSLTKEEQKEVKLSEVLQQRVLKQIERKRAQGRLYVPFGYSLAFTKEKTDSKELKVEKLRDGDVVAPDVLAQIQVQAEQEALMKGNAEGTSANLYEAPQTRVTVDAVGDYGTLLKDDQDTQWRAKELKWHKEDYMRVDRRVLEDIKKGRFLKTDDGEDEANTKHPAFNLKTVMQKQVQKEEKKQAPAQGRPTGGVETKEEGEVESEDGGDVGMGWLDEDSETESSKASQGPSLSSTLRRNQVLFPKFSARTFPCATCAGFNGPHKQHFIDFQQPKDIHYTVTLSDDGNLPPPPPGSPVSGVVVHTRSKKLEGTELEGKFSKPGVRSPVPGQSPIMSSFGGIQNTTGNPFLSGSPAESAIFGIGADLNDSASDDTALYHSRRDMSQTPQDRTVTVKRRIQQHCEADADPSSAAVYSSLQRSPSFTASRSGWGIPAHQWVDSTNLRAKMDTTLNLVHVEVHRLLLAGSKQDKIQKEGTSLVARHAKESAALKQPRQLMQKSNTPDKSLRRVPKQVLTGASVLQDMRVQPFEGKFLPRPQVAQRANQTVGTRAATPMAGKLKNESNLPQQWANKRRAPRGADERAQDFSTKDEDPQFDDSQLAGGGVGAPTASTAVFVAKQVSGRLSPLRPRTHHQSRGGTGIGRGTSPSFLEPPLSGIAEFDDSIESNLGPLMTIVDGDEWNQDGTAPTAGGISAWGTQEDLPARMSVPMQRVDTKDSLHGLRPGSQNLRAQLIPVDRTPPPPATGKYSTPKPSTSGAKRKPETTSRFTPLAALRTKAQTPAGVESYGKRKTGDHKKPSEGMGFQDEIKQSQTAQLPELHRQRWVELHNKKRQTSSTKKSHSRKE